MNNTSTVHTHDLELKLSELVRAEKSELDGQSQLTLSFSDASLLHQFLETERFRQLNNQIQEHLEKLGYLRDLPEFRNEIAGRFYMDLTYCMLANKLPETDTVLSPLRTLDFYKLLYPDNLLIKRNLDLDNLRGTYVPDGMIIRAEGQLEKIIAVCEYSLCKRPRKNRINRKYRNFLTTREEFKEFFSESYFLLVVPKGNYISENLTNKKDFKSVEMPFDRKEFGYFLRNLYTLQENR